MLLLAAVAAWLTCASCAQPETRAVQNPSGTGTQTAATRESAMTETKHDNGLILRLPPTLVARRTNTGFVVAVSGTEQSRYPVEVGVSLRRDEPQGEAEQRQIGARTIRYRVEEDEGGSGGAEYNLQAWERAGGQVILYESREQSEMGRPRFTSAWQVIEGAALAAAPRQ